MEDVMRELTDAEIHYLGNQGLGRIATIGEDGDPRVVPVAFRYNPEAGAIDIRGVGSPDASCSATCGGRA